MLVAQSPKLVVQAPPRHRVQRYLECFIACNGHSRPISGADKQERSDRGPNAPFRS
jgi:hypothetical protein